MSKVCVAMSGGVDSSVTAALLAQEYGKENVFGVTMRLFCYGQEEMDPRSCCNLEAVNDAKAVCDKIGIRHYVINFEEEFEKEVIEDFVDEYLHGRTPNPCVRCNQVIKFEYLLNKARELGAEMVATGHYARIKEVKRNEKREKGDSGQRHYRLLKGVDKAKDQSYFLYRLNQEQLAHVLFPLGEFKKEEVRDKARELGLKTAEKAESQEVCFINTNYKDFILKRFEEGRQDFKLEGEIVDREGNVLGSHLGLPFYTIGQRRGIGVAAKEPLYVLGIDIEKNRLIVGSEEELLNKECKVDEVSWVKEKPREKEFKAEIVIRYNMEPQKAIILFDGKKVKVIFKEPQRAITPGQSAVFYLGDEVLGGGIIA